MIPRRLADFDLCRLPFEAPIPIIAKKWDANITACSIQLAILAGGFAALLS
jgi:hypothetical protein